MEGAAQLNMAVFYYDYEDKQLLSEVEDLVFTTLPRLVNIPKSEVYGAEVDFNIQASENLTVRTAVSYTESEVTEFSGFRRLGTFEDFSGDEFPYTPKWQFTGSIHHDVLPNSNWGITSNLSLSYRSDASATIGDENGFEIDSYSLHNGDVSFYTPNGKWREGLYGRNLTDEYYWTSVDVQTDAIYRIPGMPREFGARGSFDY